MEVDKTCPRVPNPRVFSAQPRLEREIMTSGPGGETGLAGRRVRRTGTGHPRKS
jgi:hypothetical protein